MIFLLLVAVLPYDVLTWSVLIHFLMLTHAFLIVPVVEAVDIVLDGMYVVRLARALSRFWVSASTIRLMLKIYIVAVVKDVI